MKRIYIGNAFEPQSVIINENKTIREIYSENNVAIDPTASILFNSRALSTEDLDTPLAMLGNVADDDLIVLTQKLKGAR